MANGNSWLPLIRSAVCGAVLAVAAGTAGAAPISFSTQANGTWDADTGAGGPWSPDGGDHFYPVSGDTITFNAHAITMNSPAVFSGGTMSVSQNYFLNLKSTLTMDSGVFTYNAATGLALVAGDANGSWINNGTWNHASTQTFYWDPIGALINNGAMTFTSNGKMQVRGNPSSIDNNGTLTASGGGGDIWGLGSGLINNAGTITADGATLNLRIGVTGSGIVQAINGGRVDFDSAAGAGVLPHNTTAAASWSTAGGGSIRLGGYVGSLQGIVSGDVAFAHATWSGQALSVIDLDSSVDWLGANNHGLWRVGAGQVLELRSPLRHVGTSGYNIVNITDGTLRNVSGNTLSLDAGNTLYVDGNGSGGLFENGGTIDMIGGSNMQIRAQSGPMQLHNTTGGLLRVQNSPATISNVGELKNEGTVRADGTTLNLNVQLTGAAGLVEAINGGLITTTVTTNAPHQTGPGMVFSAAAGSEIQLGGNIGGVQGSTVGNVSFKRNLRAGQAVSFIDMAGTVVRNGNDASGTWLAEAGRILEVASPMQWSGASGYSLSTMKDGATLVNKLGNTMTWVSGNTVFWDGGGSGGFVENDGTIDNIGGRNLQLRASASSLQFHNAATGVFIVDSLPATISNNGELKNSGTIRVADTSLTVASSVVFPDYNGTDALTNGTWDVQASTVNATLNLDPANAGITTIGAGATVLLGSTGAGVAAIAEMPGLTTVDGKFRVNGTMDYDSTAGSISVSAGGSIGGTGTISDSVIVAGTIEPGASAGTLTIDGDLTLTGTTVIEVDGAVADKIVVTGTATVGGTLNLTELNAPTAGSYVIIERAAGGGTFSALPEGATVSAGGTDYTISYLGGDGNDVALTPVVGFIWSGDGSGNLASTAANWLGGTAPSGSGTETIVVDGTSGGNPDKNMTWDLPLAAGSWDQSVDYSGTVTINTTYAGSETFVVAGDLTINGGTWTHADNSTAQTNRLCVDVGGNMTVGVGGSIDVSGRGFDKSYGPGSPSTLSRAGGSYGGVGGSSILGDGSTGATYGSFTAPEDLGSGGGNWGGGNGTEGGGAVKLVVTGDLTVDGNILADSGTSGAGYRAGGSGGAILITTGTLAGGGLLQANGGSQNNTSGAGGGGRIAVALTAGNTTGSVSMAAIGGPGASTGNNGRPGAAGTIYVELASDGAGNGTLTIDNDDQVTSVTTEIPAGENWSPAALQLQDRGVLEIGSGESLTLAADPTSDSDDNNDGIRLNGGVINVTSGTLTIDYWSLIADGTSSIGANVVVGANGNVTHTDNGASADYQMDLTITGNLTVNGQVNVDGRGFDKSYGPGSPGTLSRSGASHGGLGGEGAQLVVQPTYGFFAAPNLLGSGGGAWGGGVATAGGGAIKLTVSGDTVVNGAISADSEVLAGNPNYRSGGSGGSIWLITGNLSGAGVIHANGGSSRSTSSAGGGGRVAVKLTSGTSTAVAFEAFGGERVDGPGQHGGAGTIYVETASEGAGQGTLTVANNDLVTPAVTAIPDGQSWSAGAVVIQDRGVIEVGAGETLILSGVTTDGDNADDGIRMRGGNLSITGGSLTVQDWSLIIDGANGITGNVIVAPGGIVTHSDNSTAADWKMDLTLTGNLTVQSGGTISADGKGFDKGQGPGSTGTASRAGASYAGEGGSSITGDGSVGPTYGSIQAPTDLGSGGGINGGGQGTAGGGAIKIAVSGATVVDGAISADAESLAVNYRAGGSGGSIWLLTGSLSGTGSIHANGSSQASTSGAGGGGRISIQAPGGTGGITLQAEGGPGGTGNTGHPGAAGTVYVESSPGILSVNNGSNVTDAVTYIPPSSGTYTDDLDQATLHIQSNGVVTLTADETVADLFIDATGTLDLNGYTLTVLVCEHSLDGTVVANGGQIVWVDLVPPVITCPADVTIGTNDSTNSSNTGDPTAVENCTTASFSHTDSSVVIGPDTIITRTWTATDEDNNTDTCNQTITISIICIECADLQIAVENELCGAGDVFSSGAEVIAFIDQKIAEIVAANGGEVCPPTTLAQCRLQILQALGLSP